LNLATFTGNAAVKVGTWPFITAGQRVWLRLEGRTPTGGVHVITLLDASELTGAPVGLDQPVLRTELEKLGQDTPLRVLCNVAFDGVANEAGAIVFPETVYQFKLHYDWEPPRIISVRDSKGEVANGGSTYDTHVTLTGTGTILSQVELFDGTTSYGKTTTNASGDWTHELSALAPKHYALTAHALDGSGQVSTPRTLEIQENPTPEITNVIDSLGAVPNNGSTVDTSVAVSGRCAPDQQIEFFDGTVSKGTATADGTRVWKLSVTGLSIATHVFKAKALYATGDESQPWTIKVAASVNPLITSIKDAKGVDIPPAGFTVDTAVVVTGEANPNLSVEIFDGTVSKGTVAANASGVWSLNITGLSVAAHAIKAKALYGSNPESAVRSFTVVAVVPPSIVSVIDAAGKPVSSGSSTYASRLTLSGQASINQQIEVLDGTASKGVATANGTGVWTREASGLAVGSHAFTAKALYGAGVASAVWSVTVKQEITPTLSSVKDSKGEVANGGTTTDTAVTASGKAAGSEQVEVFDGASSKGKVTATTAGDWTHPLTGLALGAHSIKAVAQYGSGSASNVRTLTVVSPIPPFVLDPSTVTLSGKFYRPGRNLGIDPPAWPANTSTTRVPSSGKAPYSYHSSNPSVVRVNQNGVITSQGNGSATITVQDSAGRSGSYQVNVSGVIIVRFLGNAPYKRAVNNASANGLRIPNLNELREMYSQYGGRWPQDEARLYSWSTDRSGLWRNMGKNLVTGQEAAMESYDDWHGAAEANAI
ncbi:MAG TPA: hypothetical protein VGC62_03735, partial [Pseudomonas sp.]|uniref:hypothetical protein n=1 Tax=Pseudomonas sp. TaxID=306 RepID=UPI002EDB5E5B